MQIWGDVLTKRQIAGIPNRTDAPEAHREDRRDDSAANAEVDAQQVETGTRMLAYVETDNDWEQERALKDFVWSLCWLLPDELEVLDDEERRATGIVSCRSIVEWVNQASDATGLFHDVASKYNIRPDAYAVAWDFRYDVALDTGGRLLFDWALASPRRRRSTQLEEINGRRRALGDLSFFRVLGTRMVTPGSRVIH
jgi:hypothetical protein